MNKKEFESRTKSMEELASSVMNGMLASGQIKMPLTDEMDNPLYDFVANIALNFAVALKTKMSQIEDDARDELL